MLNDKKYFGIILFICLALPVFSRASYWEDPRELIRNGVRFYDVKSNGNAAIIVGQEFISSPAGGGEIYLNLWSSTDAKNWKAHLRFAGPFKYADKEARIFSLALEEDGSAYITVAKGEKAAVIYRTTDLGETFTHSEIQSVLTIVSPSLFIMSNGEMLLFTIRETERALAIYYTIMDDGIFAHETQPVDLKPFVENPELGLSFLPYYQEYNGKEFVVFQSRSASQEISYYQLYVKISSDRGRSWSSAQPVTNFGEQRDGQNMAYADYSNQRPFLTVIDNNLTLTWERQYKNENPQIYRASLDADGRLREFEKITNRDFACFYPTTFSYERENYLLWFDNSRGTDHIFLAARENIDWEAEDLTYALDGNSRFPRAFILNGALYLAWENEYRNNTRLFILEPDRTVNKVTIKSTSFVQGKKYNKPLVSFRWEVPRDSSGIAGVRYSWNQNPQYDQGNMIELIKSTTRLDLRATADGIWYFRITAGDYAGNWSQPVTVVYELDTKPPGIVTFEAPSRDEAGFLESNTFEIRWQPAPGDKDLAGYAYTMERISSNPGYNPANFNLGSLKLPTPAVQTVLESREFRNRENGLWAFTVIALDDVGNAGMPNTLFLKLNKFRPYTYVSYLSVKRDDLGTDSLKFTGRGFHTDGVVTKIFLDKDGREPYDYVFTLAAGQYRIAGDTVIDNLTFSNIEGEYKVGLIHETRGIYLLNERLLLDPFGTPKIIPYIPPRILEYARAEQPLLVITVNNIVIWLILALLAAFVFASLLKILGIIKESREIEAEVSVLLHGTESALLKEEIMKKIKLKGAGLRLKFTALMSVLVLLILSIISIPLSLYMIRTQREALSTGLRNQAHVMLGSLAASAEEALPVQDDLALGVLPENSKAMEDVTGVIITDTRRRGAETAGVKEYIWSTNDPDIDKKLKEPGSALRTGESVIDDVISKEITPKMQDRINEEALEAVSDLNTEIQTLSARAAELALKSDTNSRQQFIDISTEIAEKNRTISSKLKAIANSKVASEPVFDPDNLQPDYVFYKPIVYRYKTEDKYFRGMVRLLVSTKRIQGIIDESRNALILQIALIALITLGLGIIAAIILASIIIQPIKKLVSGVAYIRDTSDKALLKEHVINIRQKDEIRMLADTINQMTQGLVKAAIANKDLVMGKETQKMFIPLQKDESGKKGTTGEEQNDYVDIFGYYEGAKGVSGDYFDFKKLDNKHYCIIKCDVSGKGVPAALIMVEVATIFIDHFRSWNPAAPDLNIAKLVYRINDLIEERGFKGRFAALTIGIINVQTGTGHFCNAGDKDIHIYRQKQGRIELQKMPEAPAAGVFPSMLIEMQSGFKQINYKLGSQDAFFFWTDGLDEAKRHLRDTNFKVIKCAAPGLKEGDIHEETHNWGTDFEELSTTRLYDVINAVFNRRRYQLVKAHNPVPGEVLTFDFTRCQGTVKEVVLAMIAVEKVFRMYKDPAADQHDRIVVDMKIDAFLEEHFDQYSEYFRFREEQPDNPGYVAFLQLKEDEQYDDLTLIAVRKK